MSALAITRVAIPPTPDAGTPVLDGPPAGAAHFRACHALLEADHFERWGDLNRCPTLAEDIEYWRGSEYEERQIFIAMHGRETVGTCSVTLPLSENTATAGINVLVAPQLRRLGWGRKLLAHAEAVALGRGRTSLDGYCEVPAEIVDGAERLLPAKSGAGGLPADDPTIAFAAAAGYELEQVERASRLTLPVPLGRLEELTAAASRSAAGYGVLTWRDTCPNELVAQYAVLRNRMSTDVPTAGLGWEAEDWDPARVRSEEQSNSRAKAANLRAAQARWPAARSVLTWNAVENQHMLAINTLLGFKPAGYEGEWQKRLG